MLGPQRVIQVLQAVLHPHLAAAVLQHAEALERPLALGWIRRERRHHEREPVPAIRVLRPRELRVEDLLPARHFAHRELHRERDLVGLGQREAGHAFLAAPHPLQPRHAVGRDDGVAIGVEPRRLLALRRGGRQPGAQDGLDPRRTRLTLSGREEAPVGAGRVAEDALDVLLVGFGRQRAQRGVEQHGRRDRPLEHVVPQRHPRAAAQQRIGQALDLFEQMRPAAVVEHEKAVAETSAIGEDELRPRPPAYAWHRRRGAAHVHRDVRHAVAVANRDDQPLRPHQPAAHRVARGQRDRRDTVARV